MSSGAPADDAAPARVQASTLARLALSLAVAGILVALLLYWSGTSLADLSRRVLALDAAAFLWSTLVLAGIYLVRGLRFWILLGPGLRPTLGRLLAISGVHGFAAYFAPAKMGEAVLVLLLRSFGGVSGSHGVALLIVARLLDLATVAGSLAIACLSLSAWGAYPDLPWLQPLGILLAVATLVFGWAGLQAQRWTDWIGAGLRRTSFAQGKLGGRIQAVLERVQGALAQVSQRRLAASVGISLVVWVGVYLYYAVLAQAFGLQLDSFAEAVFGSSLAVLANLLPINGFAGFGTQDAGWVAGFTALGADLGVATESALAFHLIYVLHIVLFGLVGQVVLVCLGRVARREAAPLEIGAE